MSNEHTPGPWYIAEEGEKPDPNSPAYAIPHAVVGANVPDGANFYICQTIHGDSYERHNANAHLIAAAPDLLEALRAVLDDLALRSTKRDADGTKVLAAGRSVVFAAQEAISKAEGLTP